MLEGMEEMCVTRLDRSGITYVAAMLSTPSELRDRHL